MRPPAPSTGHIPSRTYCAARGSATLRRSRPRKDARAMRWPRQGPARASCSTFGWRRIDPDDADVLTFALPIVSRTKLWQLSKAERGGEVDRLQGSSWPRPAPVWNLTMATPATAFARWRLDRCASPVEGTGRERHPSTSGLARPLCVGTSTTWILEQPGRPWHRGRPTTSRAGRQRECARSVHQLGFWSRVSWLRGLGRLVGRPTGAEVRPRSCPRRRRWLRRWRRLAVASW